MCTTMVVIAMAETIKMIRGNKAKEKALGNAEDKLGRDITIKIRAMIGMISEIKSLPQNPIDTKIPNTEIPSV